MPEHVILVDEDDNQIGTMEKMEAHEKGRLHRAFSLFVFNDSGELLIQQRAMEKYHCGGLWTNTVCSHPRDGEGVVEAGKRRIVEEMGISCENVKNLDHIIYKVNFENGLTENEYDYVLVGDYSGEKIKPNPEEVMDYKWITLENLHQNVKNHPEKYTPWMKIILEKGIKRK